MPRRKKPDYGTVFSARLSGKRRRKALGIMDRQGLKKTGLVRHLVDTYPEGGTVVASANPPDEDAGGEPFIVRLARRRAKA